MSNSELESSNEVLHQRTDTKSIFDRALFIRLDGSLESKSAFMTVKNLQNCPDEEDRIPPLVHLDLRFDLLRAFLEEMQKAVNQHAEIINNVQKAVKYRCTENSMAEYLERIANGLHKDCGERTFNIGINDELAKKHHQTEESPIFKRAVDKLMGKMEIISAHLLQTIKNQSKTDKRLENIEKDLAKVQLDHISKSSFAEEKRKIQNDLFEYLDKNLDNFNHTLEDHAQELENKKNQFENFVKENEAKTLWKIKDCEELLQKRVSETFVSDSISVLEAKLVTKMEKSHQQTISQATNRAEEKVNMRMAGLEKFTQQEINILNTKIVEHDSEISKRMTATDLAPLKNSIKDTRYSFEKEIESVMGHINKFIEYGRRISSLESTSKKSQSSSSGNEPGQKKEKSGGSGYNAEISIKYKIIDDKIKNLTATCDSLKADLENKADAGDLIKIENTKVSKEELLALLPSEESKDVLKEEFKNEIAYFHKTIDELARAWDLKLVKLRKEIDMFSIKKEIGRRALTEDMKHDFHVIESKCAKMEHLVSNFSFEVDGFKDFVHKVTKSINELQEMNKDVLVGNKNINCLSCGREGKKFTPSIPTLPDRDGRGIYKGRASRGFSSKLEKSITDPDIVENKFFNHRREISPLKTNQSHTHSRKKFSKPSSSYVKRRCMTASSTKSNSRSGARRAYNRPVELQNTSESHIYREENIYEQIN
ncbi:unnamed protein product [Moneuplotes crassus]|uniref:Uncharacterized protein n=1 Tax=Euplotes crassus TaxID=5936 RepID=A0AAD2DBM3_EUPCR|nr:unnamed protein product [Moneuplotes crassus]